MVFIALNWFFHDKTSPLGQPRRILSDVLLLETTTDRLFFYLFIFFFFIETTK